MAPGKLCLCFCLTMLGPSAVDTHGSACLDIGQALWQQPWLSTDVCIGDTQSLTYRYLFDTIRNWKASSKQLRPVMALGWSQRPSAFLIPRQFHKNVWPMRFNAKCFACSGCGVCCALGSSPNVDLTVHANWVDVFVGQLRWGVSNCWNGGMNSKWLLQIIVHELPLKYLLGERYQILSFVVVWTCMSGAWKFT